MLQKWDFFCWKYEMFLSRFSTRLCLFVSFTPILMKFFIWIKGVLFMNTPKSWNKKCQIWICYEYGIFCWKYGISCIVFLSSRFSTRLCLFVCSTPILMKKFYMNKGRPLHEYPKDLEQKCHIRICYKYGIFRWKSGFFCIFLQVWISTRLWLFVNSYDILNMPKGFPLHYYPEDLKQKCQIWMLQICWKYGVCIFL